MSVTVDDRRSRGIVAANDLTVTSKMTVAADDHECDSSVFGTPAYSELNQI